MPNRVIAFTIYHPGTDTPWEGAVITASLLRSFSVGTTLYPADRVVSGATGADGKGSLTLAVPSTGTADWQFRLPDGRLPRVAIADGPDTDLTTLIASAAANVPPTALQQAVDSLQAQIDALQEQTDSGPVVSVNAQTGTVLLDADDVGADSGGTAAALLAAHTAEADPHPQYQTQTEGDARYWPLSTDLATQAELDNKASAAQAVAFALIFG